MNEEIRNQLGIMLQALNTVQAHFERFAEAAQQLVNLIEAQRESDENVD